MVKNSQKFITLNILSLLGFVLAFAWLWQIFTLGHSQENWLNHPIFALITLGQQALILLGVFILFLIEFCIKKYTKFTFGIHIENKIYDFSFRLGYLFILLPFLLIGTGILLLPLTKLSSLKIYGVSGLFAVIIELFFLCKNFLFKKISP